MEKRFVDITASSGTGELHKGHGIAFADLERNGHEDIVAEIGGAVPSDKHTMRVFRNPGNDNDWINVRLTGVKSNRAAMGAEIKVTVENHGGTRAIHLSNRRRHEFVRIGTRWSSTSDWVMEHASSRSMCGGRRRIRGSNFPTWRKTSSSPSGNLTRVIRNCSGSHIVWVEVQRMLPLRQGDAWS